MDKLYNEIEDRIKSPQWSREIAHRVLLEKRHRDIKRRNIIGSLVGTAIILFTVGLYLIPAISMRNSWEYQFMSALYENENTTVFSEEIDEFIEESF